MDITEDIDKFSDKFVDEIERIYKQDTLNKIYISHNVENDIYIEFIKGKIYIVFYDNNRDVYNEFRTLLLNSYDEYTRDAAKKTIMNFVYKIPPDTTPDDFIYGNACVL